MRTPVLTNMPDNFDITTVKLSISAIAPEIVLTVAGVIILLIGAFLKERGRAFLPYLAILGLLIALTSVLSGWTAAVGSSKPEAETVRETKANAEKQVSAAEPNEFFGRTLIRDSFASFFRLLFVLIGIFSVLVSISFLRLKQAMTGEYYFLLIFAVIGMMFVAMSGDFISLYLGLELTALSTYVLIAMLKKDLLCSESAIKYFLLSAFASGMLVYGVSLLYGITGSTNFRDIGAYLSRPEVDVGNPVLVLSIILLTAGFGFKITAAPFHMYVPDVYQGAPTSVTAFLAAGPKAAAFAGLLRVYIGAISPVKPSWTMLIAALAILSMFIGNITAIVQSNVKRMLAYSSIAHGGYLLIGLAAADAESGAAGLPGGASSIIFYLFAYAIMTLGAFGTLMIVQKKDGFGEEIADFAGLGRRRPAMALAILIFMLSLAGIPPTIGFWGKLYVFGAAIKSGLYFLATLGVLNSVIAAFYYIRVVVHMYMVEPKGEAATTDISSPSLNVALFSSAMMIIVIGLFPNSIVKSAIASAQCLFH